MVKAYEALIDCLDEHILKIWGTGRYLLTGLWQILNLNFLLEVIFYNKQVHFSNQIMLG